MYSPNPYQRAASVNKYANTNVMTATPQQLIVMLYDGAIRFINTAKAMLQTKNLALYGDNMTKAQRIFNELRGHLNFEAGGEIARNLDRLYDFIDNRLCLANIKKDPALIDEAMKVILELRSAWVAIAENPTAVNQEMEKLRAAG